MTVSRDVRMLVVVAHPDDETFGCGSLIQHVVSAGGTVGVVCATRGEAGESADGDPRDLGVRRAAELRAAASVLGVSEVELYGYADSGMSGDVAHDSLAGASFEQVVADVRRSIGTFGPDLVLTLDASDGHRDHVRIRDAALAAGTAAGVPRIYLSCLPRSLMRRWAEHMMTIRPSMEHLDADVAGLGTPDASLTTIIDVSSGLPTLEKAMAEHATQTSPYAGLPPELYEAFLATAHAQRVVPPWPADAAPERSLLTP